MRNLPSGTVTFLFTDIQGSTKLGQQYPDAIPALLARHNQILNQSIESHDGFVFQVVGDSFAASFHGAKDALNAALDAQRSLHRETWSPASIQVRMGIHTGAAQWEPESKENPYSGYATLALTQRIMSAGHGGQILLSQSAFELTRVLLPEQARLVDMGEWHLKDVLREEHLYQLSVPDLPSEFEPLNTLESSNHNLPTQFTSFIGREKEIAEIKALLNSARLVTLTGSGGTGKTRLSIEVGTQLYPNFHHGVWFIELAPLSDPAQIIPALASLWAAGGSRSSAGFYDDGAGDSVGARGEPMKTGAWAANPA
jgi:class 3 adenylate cyclase